MKRCPRCGQFFDAVNDYCLDDGTRLVLGGAAGMSGDVPTQIVNRAVPSAPSRIAWTPIVLIVLVVTLAGLGALLVIRLTDNERSETRFETVETNRPNESAVTNSNASAAASAPFTNTADTTVTSPNGRWTGDWSSSSGAYLTLDVTLNESTGEIDGQIGWRLVRTLRRDKMSKIGSTAIEYVRGRYDPATRVVTMSGYRKDDPNNMLVMLDQYRLNLSPGGRTLGGSAKNGGQWNARVNLSR